VDVTAVNSQTQFQAQLSPSFGSVMSGGHLGQTETLGGQLQYQESPTITYTPLQGAALVQQITTPISVDSIAQLFDSDWELGTVLTFVADRLSADYEKKYDVINDLSTLDSYGLLVIVATKSSATPGGPAGSGAADDSLLIMCDVSRAKPEQRENATIAWNRLIEQYKNSLISPTTPGATATYTASISGSGTINSSATLPAPPATAPTGDIANNYCIELRTVPVRTADGAAKAIPLLRTRSALGMLSRAVEEDAQFITFLDPNGDDFKQKWQPYEKNYIDHPFLQFNLIDDPNTASHPGGLRHFVAVLHKPGLPPANAYSAVFYRSEWYYIDNDDFISQENFRLVNLILSLQAVAPSSSGAPTPTLPVGGH
jgi:hypothetical protein